MNDAADAARSLLTDGPRALALFVDFDGSLAEIVADPALAVPVPGALDALHGLAALLGVVAVLSGRPGAFLAERLELARHRSGLRAFGHYGADEVRPDGTVVGASTSETSTRFSSLAADARALAPDAIIEEKGSSVALHFRTAPQSEAALRALAARAAARDGLELREGRMVIELVPADAPNKAVVVRRLARDAAACCAIGDDIGDLASFDALDELSESGKTVLRVAVANAEGPPVLLARADLVLAGPPATAAFLGELLALARAA